jgi:hypothetical protein
MGLGWLVRRPSAKWNGVAGAAGVMGWAWLPNVGWAGRMVFLHKLQNKFFSRSSTFKTILFISKRNF